jgi:hypothetical protein
MPPNKKSGVPDQKDAAKTNAKVNTDKVDSDVKYNGQTWEEFLSDKKTFGTPVEDFLLENEPDPPSIIEGMLALGSVALIQGGAKTNKSWTAKEIAIRVAQGQVWLGHKCNKGRVLYVNAEIRARVLRKRLLLLSDKKALGAIPTGQLELLNLRGCDATIDSLTDDICENVRPREYALIILDPIYTLLGGREENANEKIAEVIKLLHRIAEHTQAAVLFVHHHSKGSQGSKRSLERSSGAGAFGRGPDLIIDILDKGGVFEFDVTQREFEPVDPFYAKRTEAPIWELCDAPEIDPETSKQGTPGPKVNPLEIVVLFASNNRLSYKEVVERYETMNESESTAKRRLKKGLEDKVLRKLDDGSYELVAERIAEIKSEGKKATMAKVRGLGFKFKFPLREIVNVNPNQRPRSLKARSQVLHGCRDLDLFAFSIFGQQLELKKTKKRI